MGNARLVTAPKLINQLGKMLNSPKHSTKGTPAIFILPLIEPLDYLVITTHFSTAFFPQHHVLLANYKVLINIILSAVHP